MPALIVTITGNAKKLEAEMLKIQALAKRTGQNIQASMNGATPGGGGGGIQHGAMREAMVLIRELARGDLKRAASSASILADKLGLLKYLLNPVTGIIAGLAAGAYAAYKLSSALVEKLSGLKMPEFHPEAIPQYLQKLGQVAEAHRKIGDEIRSMEEGYDSAAKAAERLADVAKEQFDHERRMNELAEQRDLNSARTEAEKQAIRKRYSDMDIALQKKEHAAHIKAMQDEQKALEQESIAKSEQADSITKRTPSKAADEQNLRKLKLEADDAQKYLNAEAVLKDENASKEAKKAAEELVRPMGWVMKTYNGLALSGVGNSQVDAARAEASKEAQRRIDAYTGFQGTAHNNEIQRQRADDLNRQAGDAAKRATGLGLQIPFQQQLNAQKEANAQAEATAKLEADTAREQKAKALHGETNSLQKVGAYTSPATVALIDVNRKIHSEIKGLRHDLAKHGASGGHGMSEVKY